MRGLATARNSGDAFDLRCDLREGLLAFIREEMPEALPRIRQYQQRLEPAATDTHPVPG